MRGTLCSLAYSPVYSREKEGTTMATKNTTTTNSAKNNGFDLSKYAKKEVKETGIKLPTNFQKWMNTVYMSNTDLLNDVCKATAALLESGKSLYELGLSGMASYKFYNNSLLVTFKDKTSIELQTPSAAVIADAINSLYSETAKKQISKDITGSKTDGIPSMPLDEVNELFTALATDSLKGLNLSDRFRDHCCKALNIPLIR